MDEAGESVAGNAAAGFREGVYGTLGLPVDAATWLVNRGIDGVNAVAGSEISNLGDLPLGSRSIATNLERYAGIPDPAKVRAVTLAEKAARAAGEGASYAIAPQALLRAGAVAAGTRLLPALETRTPCVGSPAMRWPAASAEAPCDAGGSTKMLADDRTQVHYFQPGRRRAIDSPQGIRPATPGMPLPHAAAPPPAPISSLSPLGQDGGRMART